MHALRAGVLTFRTKTTDLPEYACAIGIAVCFRCLPFMVQDTTRETIRCHGFASGLCTNLNITLIDIIMVSNVSGADDAFVSARLILIYAGFAN